ncbi:MAG: hypothetical protein Q9162_000862 [Coniocarpon cinnabarinum]
MSASASSTPTPKPPTSPSLSVLSAHLNTTDETLAHARRILATTSGVDATLLLTGYGSQFFASLLTRLINLRISVAAERSAKSTASVAARTLETGEVLLATFALPGARMEAIRDGLKTLASSCSDIRAFMRLWSLLGIWAWGRRLVGGEAPKDGVLRVCAYAQCIANLMYLLYEHPIYLTGKGILKIPSMTPQRMKGQFVTAARWFAVHVVFEFIRLYRTYSLRRVEEELTRGKPTTTQMIEQEQRKHEDEDRAWWKSLGVYAAYAPLAAHWSVEGGFLGEGTVGFLGMCAGILGVRECWRQTA